jgi:hypothetical protein
MKISSRPDEFDIKKIRLEPNEVLLVQVDLTGVNDPQYYADIIHNRFAELLSSDKIVVMDKSVVFTKITP